MGVTIHLGVLTTSTTKLQELAYDSSSSDIRLKDINPTARMFPAGSSQGLVEGDYQFIYGWFGLRRHCHRSLVSLPSMDFYRYSTDRFCFLMTVVTGHSPNNAG